MLGAICTFELAATVALAFGGAPILAAATIGVATSTQLAGTPARARLTWQRFPA